MNLITKIPGPILIFLGAFCLSFGGLIVKSFEGATLWQILFWRSIFFSIVVGIFLLITHKKKIFNSFYESGLPGFIGGLILSLGYCGYVFAMYNTTVANTNFIIQTQTIFLAVFGYIFLKEKNFKTNFVFNYICFYWNNVDGWKFFIAWTDIRKYSCIHNAYFIRHTYFNCKKVSRY